MDKDRIKGSVRQAKGTLKEVLGKVAGDAKLEAEGRTRFAASNRYQSPAQAGLSSLASMSE